jgi:hypothetical protein
MTTPRSAQSDLLDGIGPAKSRSVSPGVAVVSEVVAQRVCGGRIRTVMKGNLAGDSHAWDNIPGFAVGRLNLLFVDIFGKLYRSLRANLRWRNAGRWLIWQKVEVFAR